MSREILFELARNYRLFYPNKSWQECMEAAGKVYKRMKTCKRESNTLNLNPNEGQAVADLKIKQELNSAQRNIQAAPTPIVEPSKPPPPPPNPLLKTKSHTEETVKHQEAPMVVPSIPPPPPGIKFSEEKYKPVIGKINLESTLTQSAMNPFEQIRALRALREQGEKVIEADSIPDAQKKKKVNFAEAEAKRREFEAEMEKKKWQAAKAEQVGSGMLRRYRRRNIF